MKNLLFTLALLVSFNSFGQNSDSLLLNIPKPTLALKDYNEKEGVYQISKNEISNIFNKLYVKSNIVKGGKYIVGWKDYERKIPADIIIGDNIEYTCNSIRITFPNNNSWEVNNWKNPPEQLIKQLNNLKKGDLIIIYDNKSTRLKGSTLVITSSPVMINVAD